MHNLKSSVKGFFKLDDVPHPKGSVVPKYTDTTVTLESVENGRPVFYGVVGDIQNGDTGVLFATIADIKTYIENNFFREAGVGTGGTQYLRQAATRCFIPRSFNAGITYNNSASVHISREKLVNPILLMPNFWVNNHSDVGNLAGTIKVSIECPIGAPVVYSDLNIANGNNAVPFPIGILAMQVSTVIPENTEFRVRTYQYNVNGCVWFQYQQGYIVPSGESCDLGSGVGIDKTGGAALSAATNATYGPCAILSMTSRPAVAIIGDSREEGGTEIITDKTYDVGLTARSVGPLFGYTTFAESGSLLAQWNAATRTYRDMILKGTVPGVGDGVTPYFSHISNAYGINDISAGDSGATLAGRRTTFAALYPKSIVIGHTLLPYNVSTDAWTTKANQGLGANQVRVAAFNDLARAGIAGETFMWDVADAIDPYRSNTFAVTRNPYDAIFTPTCQFTGSLTATTLTVTAVAAGTLKVGDTITDNLTNLGSIQPGTIIKAILTGSGGIGTYTVNKSHSGFPYANAVASKAMYTGAIITNDGLHVTATGSEVIRDSKKVDTTRIILR